MATILAGSLTARQRRSLLNRWIDRAHHSYLAELHIACRTGAAEFTAIANSWLPFLVWTASSPPLTPTPPRLAATKLLRADSVEVADLMRRVMHRTVGAA